jgi:NDP-sugar pyrophosphorylase family protein
VKAVILVGGEGTRLRPLTLQTPKPVVPVVDRPFLRYQLDLLARAGISQVVFSVAYKPERIQQVFGDGSALGRRIRYAVEETPLGTGGAVKNAEAELDDVTVVFNGDVLTDVDLPAVVAAHRKARASATIVLFPVPNPAAYGLVETDAHGRVTRFIEKPKPEQITTDRINAGIYVLETSTLSLIPAGANHSIERGFFPALLARGDLVLGYVHRGYWIDIGTPEKYLQVHRDILEQRFPVATSGETRGSGRVDASASVHASARLEGPFYIGPGCLVEAGAEIGRGAVLTRDVTVRAGARVVDSVLWQGVEVGPDAMVLGALLAENVTVGRSARVGQGAVLGAAARLPDYSRTS